jgi:hypothetical protein
VLRRGQVVFDRAGGLADLGRREPVTPHTPFLVFSIAKSFTAMAIHSLIEQGRVDCDAPVATYWPEFGRHGKETATLRHTLLHQAGMPSAGMHWQVPLRPNWGLVTRSVARTPADRRYSKMIGVEEMLSKSAPVEDLLAIVHGRLLTATLIQDIVASRLQGAMVLLISAGWDRGDINLLKHEMERLQLSCHRLIWLNPLLGSENYEPLTRGIQTALSYIDDFMRSTI